MSTSSKSKVIVLTVVQEGISASAVAKRYGVSKRWVKLGRQGLDTAAETIDWLVQEADLLVPAAFTIGGHYRVRLGQVDTFGKVALRRE